MINREKIKEEVIKVIDIISPLDLKKMDHKEVELLVIGYNSGFDPSLKAAIAIPLGKIAIKSGGKSARPIAYTETQALKTVKGAIDLTMAACEGKPYEGEN